MARARGQSLQAQRVAAGVAGVVARAGHVRVVAGVAVAADAQVEGAARGRRPALRRVRAAGAEVRRDQQLRARGVEDARVGVQACRVGHVHRELVARGEVQPVQVHVQRVGHAGVDLHALVQAQRRIQRGGQGVAHVARRREVGQRGDGEVAAAQRAAATGRGDGDGARTDATGHGQGEQLLVGGGAGAVDGGAHVEAAHRAAVDGDGQVVGGQPRAFEHEGVARDDRAAHGTQRGHHLQPEARTAAQHADRAAAGERGHHHAERGAAVTDRAGARERAQRAAVVEPLELHQRAGGKALTLQHDGLAGHRRGLAGLGRDAAGSNGGDAGEHADRLRTEARPRDLRPAAFGGDADRPVQRARRHHRQAVVARAGDVEGGQVGGAVDQRHAPDGDGQSPFHEARAAQVELAVFARAARVDARQRGHHLQPDAGAGAQGLRAAGVRRVGQRLAQHAHAVNADVDQVRAVAGVVAVPGVEHEQVKAQAVALPGGQPAQAQRLAGVVAEAPAEAGEGGDAFAVDAALAPRRVGRAGLEVVGEDDRVAAAHDHVVDAPALVGHALQPAVAKAHNGAAGAGGEVHRHLAVHRVRVATKAEVARALVDHAHVARGRRIGHQHLQPGAAGVDDQRRLRDHAGVGGVVPGVKEHPRAGAEVAADQFDDLADVGRRLRGVGRHAVASAGDDLAERGRGHGHRVHRGVDAVELALRGGDPETAVGGKAQARDLVVVEALGAGVHAAQLGEHAAGLDAVLHELRPAVDRSQPQVAAGPIYGQPRPRLHVERPRDHPELRPAGRAQLDDAVARPVLLGQIDMAVARVEGRPGQVVVAVQRQAGNDRARARVDRDHPVRVGVAVEHQQAARGHVGRAQRHRRAQHLQPGVVVHGGRAVVAAQRDGLHHRAVVRIDAQQMARAGVVAHPDRPAGRIDRHVAQRRALHAQAHRVQRHRRTGAPGRAHAHVAQPVARQRRAVEVGPPVLCAEVRRVVHVHVVARIHPRVDHRRPGKAVAARPLDEARAQQHRAVLHVNALHRGHDLQQRLGGRAKDLQRERPVGVRRHQQRRARAVARRRRRAQLHHLQRPVDVHIAQQDVGAGVQPRPVQPHRLPRIGRRLPRIGRRPRQRHRRDRAQPHAVRRAHPTAGLDADRTKHPRAQRYRHPHVPVRNVPQHRIVARQNIRTRGRARVQHGARAEAVLGPAALDKTGAGDQQRRRGAVGGHGFNLHVTDDRQHLQRERAIGEIGAHRTHLQMHHRIAGGGIQWHGEERDTAIDVHAQHVDDTCGHVAGRVDDLEVGTGVARVERHRDTDLLTWVGRGCGRDLGHATGGPDITGRPDAEPALDGHRQHVASAVGDDRWVDAQAVVAGRQHAVDDHAQRLAEAAGIQAHFHRGVVGGAEDAIVAGTQQRNAVGGQSHCVERFVERDVDRTHEEDPRALGQVHGRHRGREGVGHHVEHDHVGQRGIAAGVGGANLHRERTAAAGDGGRLCEQFERERDVVGHDHTVDQQLDVAHLHVVGDRRQHADGASFKHLHARGARGGVDAVHRDRHDRGSACAVQRDVVDDLQATAAVGHKSQARGQHNILRRSRQVDARQERTSVGRVGTIAQVKHIELFTPRAAQVADADHEPRAIERQTLAGDVHGVNATERHQVRRIGDVDGLVALCKAVLGTHIRHACADEKAATALAQGS